MISIMEFRNFIVLLTFAWRPFLLTAKLYLVFARASGKLEKQGSKGEALDCDMV